MPKKNSQLPRHAAFLEQFGAWEELERSLRYVFRLEREGWVTTPLLLTPTQGPVLDSPCVYSQGNRTLAPWVFSIWSKVGLGREAMEQNGKEHICVCSSWGGPGVGMGKGWKGRVQGSLEGRVQTEHLGLFESRRRPDRNITAKERTSWVVLIHQPFIYLSSHHLVFYHSLGAVIYLTDIIFFGQKLLKQTSEPLIFFFFFDKHFSESSQQSHTVISKFPNSLFQNSGLEDAGSSP